MQYPGLSMPTERDIAAQLDRLNHDFFEPPKVFAQGSIDATTDYPQRATDPHIRFCLPTQTPQGLPTNGILSAVSEQAVWKVEEQDLKMGEKGGSPSWEPRRYLNIWVGPLPDGTAGYAQMPGGNPATDGIVINSRYFAQADALERYGMDIPLKGEYPYDYGKPQDGLGRTLVHLVGNYLNLYDLWNEDSPCTDDYVWDTPMHNAPNFGQPIYKHVSTCGAPDLEDPEPEMTMNLMDNTDDVAQHMFTLGQVRRMHATLATDGPRGGLRLTPTHCQPGLVPEDIVQKREKAMDEAPVLQLKVFPNPAVTSFALEISSPIVISSSVSLDIRVTNALGELVWQQKNSQFNGHLTIQVDSSQWPSGFYTVQAVSGENQQLIKLLLDR
jgi:hypothetical protein